jgi:NAD(P)-dependent dehydrogenase (short-subunit alcohol dehydrogenase family)
VPREAAADDERAEDRAYCRQNSLGREIPVNRKTLFDVQGHVAFITGAASGLGLAYAEVMAENGAVTVLADKDGPGLEKAAARLRSAGCKVATAAFDAVDSNALQQAIDGAAARYGRLDAVFANVGISAGPGFASSETGRIEAIDLQRFREVIELNLIATTLTMKFAAPHMKRQRSGSIVVTASIAGIAAEPLVGYGYIASKAAVANIVRQAALELAAYHVRVNAIAPGPFVTNIRDGIMHRDPKIAEQFAAMVPLGRAAQPDEIKGLALLLASPAGSFITGAVIPIDGGTTAK